jgi:hypothetical protein
VLTYLGDPNHRHNIGAVIILTAIAGMDLEIPATRIAKSEGMTPTEKYLSDLCDGTFLKLWSYPNPFREPGKELCDLIAVFGKHVFLFFDRHTNAFERDINPGRAWVRWKKEAIDKQIKSSKRANTHILRGNPVYLDARCTIAFPVKFPDPQTISVHVIIVAHGAADACKRASPHNVSGSLAISYFDTDGAPSAPFLVNLPRDEIVHVLDSNTISIILGELDTITDFSDYISAKENAIRQFNLSYAGEEDVLAHYYSNFDKLTNKHYIGTKDQSFDFVFISEGEWEGFRQSEPYRRKKKADQVSYLWDSLLQRTTQNALDGTLLGDGGIFESKSAIFEMAKEPRFFRRGLSEAMQQAISNFPESAKGIVRNVSLMPSFHQGTAYVFLQLHVPRVSDYDEDYRPKRQALLEIACGAARNKNPKLKKIIGIAIDAPKFTQQNSEDFILMECENWPDALRLHYDELNKEWQFFNSPSLKVKMKTTSNFPRPKAQKRWIRQNEPCPCGSGRKYKRCHGRA